MLIDQFNMREIYPLLLEVMESGGELRLSPRGTSMLPLLREGRDSVLLVKPQMLKKRQICLYRRRDGSFVLHRILKFDQNKNPVFCGDNQTKKEYGISQNDVVAVVSAVYRDEKKVDADAASFRLYSIFHCFMPWRRCYFFLRRVKSKLFRCLKKKG